MAIAIQVRSKNEARYSEKVYASETKLLLINEKKIILFLPLFSCVMQIYNTDYNNKMYITLITNLVNFREVNYTVLQPTEWLIGSIVLFVNVISEMILTSLHTSRK